MSYLCSCAQAVTGSSHGRAFALLVGFARRNIMRFSVCWRILKLNHGAVFKNSIQSQLGAVFWRKLQNWIIVQFLTYRFTPLVLSHMRNPKDVYIQICTMLTPHEVWEFFVIILKYPAFGFFGAFTWKINSHGVFFSSDMG